MTAFAKSATKVMLFCQTDNEVRHSYTRSPSLADNCQNDKLYFLIAENRLFPAQV